MSEAHLRRRVVQWLRPLHAVPVENPACPGSPDVNYTEGWIELKKLTGWPKSPDSIVRVPHFTPQQRNWLRLRRRAGGRCHLLIQVKNEFLLMDGIMAAECLGYMTRQSLIDHSVRYWSTGLRAEELRGTLLAS